MKHSYIDGILIPTPECWADAIELIRSDYYRSLGQRLGSVWSLWLRHFRDQGNGFQFYFRLGQYKPRTIGGKIMRRYFVHRMVRYARRHALQIPVATKIGYGLYLCHSHGVIINPTAVIGSNVSLYQFTTIGSSDKTNAARIEDGVAVGPSTCVVGPVRIGANSEIGAGAVVVHDIPSACTAAGVPARVLHDNRPTEPSNAWPVPQIISESDQHNDNDQD